MKKRLFLISVLLLLTGCVAVPVYDSGYYYPDYYGSYPYGYVSPGVNVFVSGRYYGGHGFYGGRHGFHGGGHGFHGGGGGFRRGGGGFHGGWRR